MASSAQSHGGETRIARALSWNRRPVAEGPPPSTTYPATVDAVAAARSEVVGTAREAGASPETLADIELAVSEAATNAVLHAYASPGTRGAAIAISTAFRGPLFSVWVTDEGRGGPPDVPSPGLGLGLQLMAKLCDRMVIGVLHDGRTQVEMQFDLQAAPC